MKKSKKFLVFLVIVSIFIATGNLFAQAGKEVTTEAGEDPRFISIAGGSVGGEWYVLCGVISEMLGPVFPNTNIKVATGGSVSNPMNVSAGKVEVATTQDNVFADALAGEGTYTSEGPIGEISGLLRLGQIYMSVFLVEEKIEI